MEVDAAVVAACAGEGHDGAVAGGAGLVVEPHGNREHVQVEQNFGVDLAVPLEDRKGGLFVAQYQSQWLRKVLPPFRKRSPIPP